MSTPSTSSVSTTGATDGDDDSSTDLSDSSQVFPDDYYKPDTPDPRRAFLYSTGPTRDTPKSTDNDEARPCAKIAGPQPPTYGPQTHLQAIQSRRTPIPANYIVKRGPSLIPYGAVHHIYLPMSDQPDRPGHVPLHLAWEPHTQRNAGWI